MENLPTYTIPAPKHIKEIVLSDGRIAKIYKLKGRDVRQSMAMAQPMIEAAGKDKAAAGIAIMHCQVAVATTIDDLPQTPATLDDLDAKDYQALFAAYSEGNPQGE